MSLLQIALPLLRLNAGLHHVRARDFAAVLQLLADLQKPPRLGVGALSAGILALRCNQSVVSLSNGDDQAARSDFSFSPRLRQRCSRAPIVREIGERERFMGIRLADVFVHAIVRDETADGTSGTDCARGGLAGALGVNEGVVVCDVGQQSGASLYAVFSCYSEIGQSRMILDIIGARPLQRILQRDRQRRPVGWSSVGGP